MNIVLRLVLVSALVFCVASPAGALMRKDMGLVRGKVVDYDPRTRVLIVDGNRGEGKVQFDLSSAQVTVPTNPGEEVVVIYKLEGNKATVVKSPPNR
ncbi:MAG: hypothetical protein HQL20_01950 [Candidatus Omnitrophica bacterium]|nr:hypothetical protein [Candidatus Omnitrophota bacterium]